MFHIIESDCYWFKITFDFKTIYAFKMKVFYYKSWSFLTTLSISSNLWHTLNGFNNTFSFFFLQLRMFIMENSKFPIMLGMICYLIPIPRCLKIWLAKLKLDWMNCLSTQRWEKRLFSIFVWRILGKKKKPIKFIQIRKFDFYEISIL